LFFIPGMPQEQVSLPLFTVGVVAISIFDTALYLRAGANLLLAMLVHLLANVCGGLALGARSLNVFLAAEGIAAAIVVLAGGLRSSFTTNQEYEGATHVGAAEKPHPIKTWSLGVHAASMSRRPTPQPDELIHEVFGLMSGFMFAKR
jgi:hypothetical protein